MEGIEHGCRTRPHKHAEESTAGETPSRQERGRLCRFCSNGQAIIDQTPVEEVFGGIVRTLLFKDLLPPGDLRLHPEIFEYQDQGQNQFRNGETCAESRDKIPF